MKLKGLATLALAASMVPASATIARLKALGMDETDNEGSYYIQDDRNIFLNVANIHSYADSAIIEWGGNGQNLPRSTTAVISGNAITLDQDTAPKAKGGFLKSHGDYVYGVYLGNESNTSSLLRTVATGANAAQASLPLASLGDNTNSTLRGADNQIDLFFGGKASSMDWGVNLVYTASNDQSARSRDVAHAVRIGLKSNKWDAFANISTGAKVKKVSNATVGSFNGDLYHEFDGSLGFHLGGGYQVTDTGRAYGFVKKFDWDQTDSGGATAGLASPTLNGRGQSGTVEGGFMTYAVGYGEVRKSGKGTLFTNIEYRSKEIELKFNTKPEAKNVEIPVTVGYEYEATNWLTFRGSVKHNLYGVRENNNYSSLNILGSVVAQGEFGADTGGKKATITNSTDINAGASLNLGRVRIDGFIGTTGSARNATSSSEQGVLALDNLMTRVGMVYSF